MNLKGIASNTEQYLADSDIVSFHQTSKILHQKLCEQPGQPLMAASFLSLPTEIIEYVVQYLDGSDIASVRQTCRRVRETSHRNFIQLLAQNKYFTLQHSLKKLEAISRHESFRECVETLRIHPNSLVWDPARPLPPCIQAGAGGIHSKVFKHPADDHHNEEYCSMLRYSLLYQRSGCSHRALVGAFEKLPKLTKIELGSWGQSMQTVVSSSSPMRKFHNDTGYALLHFDFQMPYKGPFSGHRALSRISRDGTLSLTDDFNLIIAVLSETQKPIVEFRAGYLSDLGLKCIQIQDAPMLQDSLNLKASFLHLKVLHLAMGFERGRQGPDIEPFNLSRSKNWLSRFLDLTPNLQDLTLVFDGFQVRENPEFPDWSGSIFHHAVTGTKRLSRLRRLDLQNMYVHWRDVSEFLDRHKETLVEVSFNCMTMWTVAEEQSVFGVPEIKKPSWLATLKNQLRSMPILQYINIARLRVNESLMSFFPEELIHCDGCRDRRGTYHYAARSCPHYAFGNARDDALVSSRAAHNSFGPPTNRLEHFLEFPTVMMREGGRAVAPPFFVNPRPFTYPIIGDPWDYNSRLYQEDGSPIYI